MWLYCFLIKHVVSLVKIFKIKYMSVVYFDQHLGAVHSKHWSKYAFFMFFKCEGRKRLKN